MDILIKSLGIAVEFDGSYSHKGKEHEQRDVLKTKKLRDAGYKVVRIREEPLALVNPQHDISVEQDRVPDVKAITTKVLRHMVSLGWIPSDIASSYAKAPSQSAAERAERIYESLPLSERFVPLSAKAPRKRRDAEEGGTDKRSK
ncbi:DUF559 domain-containing protein [Arthrobacter globiformis]|uniref:DUF559 domain-containing protein n=1 Tax=Arthrobacter globiformis TaxID=1665 RepID=UPI0027D92A8E|nr:DUF559 domain-containing protein [Arthrobacter globiformis]